MQKLKTKYGSVLVFTLIILFIGVVAALGITSTTVISQKMSGTTGKSVQSFQVADSGAEIFLKTIKDAEDGTLGNIGFSCNEGIITGNIGTGKDYSIIAYDSDEREIDNCNTSISDIAKIKSIGTHANTSRAIELAVAAGGSGCYVSYKESCTGDSCCIAGFTNEGSVEEWGHCCLDTSCFFLPAGGSCPGSWNQSLTYEAHLCCK